MAPLKRDLDRWQRFILAMSPVVPLACLGFAVACLVDRAFHLSWGFTWTDFWVSLALLVGSTLLGLFVMLVHGLFAGDEIRSVEQVREEAGARPRTGRRS